MNLRTDIRDLCSVTLDENNQVLVEEEMDKKNRSRNFIIHGKTEDGATEDNNFVNNLFKDLQIRAPTIKQIETVWASLGLKTSLNTILFGAKSWGGAHLVTPIGSCRVS